MKEIIKSYWEYIQDLLDVNGDVLMLLFTLVIIYKVAHGGLTSSDAMVYGSAVGCFAWSNKGKPKI